MFFHFSFREKTQTVNDLVHDLVSDLDLINSLVNGIVDDGLSMILD